MAIGLRQTDMDHATARDRLAAAAPSEVHVLDAAKAARFRARTMLIPSALDVRSAIAAIPAGETRSVLDIRRQLAEVFDAEVTCPRATSLAWLLVAEAAEEARRDGAPDVTPWWRVTLDRKPNPRLPGGIDGHRERLAAEGIAL